MVAFDARIELVGARQERRTVRLEDFFVAPEVDLRRENDLQPGELLTAIMLPPQPAGARSVHIKQGETDSFDWPIADVAVALDLAGDGTCRKAAIVLGAAAPVPHRAKSAEAALIGAPIDDSKATAAAKAALTDAMPLSKNDYKLPVFQTLIRRALLAASRQG